MVGKFVGAPLAAPANLRQRRFFTRAQIFYTGAASGAPTINIWGLEIHFNRKQEN